MQKPIIERVLERGLFMSRWLMAPFYVGLIGAVIALMMWLYLSAYIVLFGAVLNAEIARLSGNQ